MHFTRIGASVAALAAMVAGVASPAAAQDKIAQFYKGRTVTILVGAGAGGSFMLYAQLLADHMKRHIPGEPNMVAKSLGGQGGGLETAIIMQNTASKDGLTMGLTQNTVVLAQVINPQYAKYDARTWNWVGNMTYLPNALAVWHTAKAQTLEEAKKVQIVAGSTGPNSPTYIVPNFLNKFAGTKFKIVSGYKGTRDLDVAMMRGEIDARGGSWFSVEINLPTELKEKKIKPLVVASTKRLPRIKDTPTIIELVSDPRQKQAAMFLSADAEFSRAFFLPPGVPADRIAALRKAFADTMKDEKMLADAKKRRMPIEPTTPAELEEATKRVLATPKDVADLAK
ncbi:MAG: Bug family tripartite tricarboxylate transporter substrate binding protein [Hyphomicrobiaceae bacterium]